MTFRDRRRAKRKLLKKEIASRLRPRLLELGFERTRTREGLEAWPGVARQGFDYARRRDGYLDQLELYWDKWGRPWFSLYFSIGRADDPSSAAGGVAGEVRTNYYSGLLGLIGVKQRWFGRGQDPVLAVSLAVAGVEALDLFLRTGEASDHLEIMNVGYQRVRGPINNWDLIGIVWALPLLLFEIGPRRRNAPQPNAPID